MEVFIMMIGTYNVYQQPVWMLTLFCIALLWTVIWNGLGLWYSARHQQKGWFVALLILNTLGLLPIIYLIWFKPREKRAESGTEISVEDKPRKTAKKAKKKK